MAPSGTSSDRPLRCVVMAGGRGTRMRSALPKVLHPICGRPILGWVVEAARSAGAELVAVVTPPDDDAIAGVLGDDCVRAIQPIARGTGDAVRWGIDALPDLEGDVLIVSGDTPLITDETLRGLVEAHRGSGALATLLTVDIPPPHAYGRVVRTPEGDFDRIVEAKDATPAELELAEINAGFYVADCARLRAALDRIEPDNAQGELYLPDAIAILCGEGERVVAHRIDDATSLHGINSRVDLAFCERLMRERLLEAHMVAGVTIVDPQTTFIEPTVTLDADSRIEPFTVLRGTTHVAAGAVVGPHAVLIDAEVGPGATAGPFCYLRPGAKLLAKAKVGTFVEVKNSELGEGAKVPHLSYVGDATVGPGSNIAAGNITANYHAGEKHRTTIGARVRTGSDNVFVAPVTVGDDAVIAAGSIITDDVPAGALAIARARQVNKDGRGGKAPDA